jgi:cyclic pyranopterin phosphate synthase
MIAMIGADDIGDGPCSGVPYDGAMLIDSFGRVVRDLRISVTDRCNFRCRYCMPAEGLPWLPSADVLTVAEVARIAGIAIRLGVAEVKLTGGEPTVRRELPDIVGALRTADEHIDISITTNGQLLDRLAQPLRDAGLDRVTISCDSLLRHRFAELTRRDALDAVLRGLDAAASVGLGPIKVNCVVIAGTNDDEVVDFARLARATGYGVRFIEYMPLDAEQQWDASHVRASDDLRALIDRTYPLVADDEHGPASRFAFADGAPGSVGFISSVSAPFCASCDRMRITADGQLRSCLFATEETDLRTPLRGGASDAELEQLISDTVAGKWAGHRIGQADFVRPERSMSQIGG